MNIVQQLCHNMNSVSVNSIKINPNKHIDCGMIYFKSILPPAYDHLMDAYGSAMYSHNGEEWYLSNTYGEEDVYPKNVAFCACFIKSDLTHLQIGDIQYSGRQFIVKRYLSFPIPEPIQKDKWLGLGKRGFYYLRNKKQVSLKSSFRIIEYEHIEASDWVSAPRVLVGKGYA